MLEKCRPKKVTKTFFLNSHEYRDQKIGEQNARDNFSRNTISASKKYLEKIVGKNCEKRFFVFTRISWPKNGEGGKTRETIFPETHE